MSSLIKHLSISLVCLVAMALTLVPCGPGLAECVCEECCDGYWGWVCYDNDGVPGVQVPNDGWNGEPAAPGGDWDWCEWACVSFCYDCAGDPSFVQGDRRELSKLQALLAKRHKEKAARSNAGATASARTS